MFCQYIIYIFLYEYTIIYNRYKGMVKNGTAR